MVVSFQEQKSPPKGNVLVHALMGSEGVAGGGLRFLNMGRFYLFVVLQDLRHGAEMLRRAPSCF